MIKLENVTYRYEQGPQALDNVSLAIADGEAVAVMGANGSGKTTFARLVAGLYEPARGRVSVDGGNGSGGTVGILFQNPDNQMVAVTVEKEIAFALENRATPPDEMEERISATLARFRIEHLRRRLTSELSGGEKQRVALASVMVCEPTILVLDEPDSFLDEAGKAALTAELAELQRRNRSMIQVHITQYPQVAAGYERLIVFDRGEIVADRAPSEIFANREFCIATALGFDPSTTNTGTWPVVTEPGQQSRITRIDLQQVAFGYRNGPTVLGPLTTTFAAGEITAVVGPSGAGKSTLGLLLCGLMRPSEGELTYRDDHAAEVPREEIPGRVASILQQPERQFFLPTCGEEVSFGPNNIGRPLRAEDLAAMLDAVGLEAETFTPRDPFRLSGGEKRRLAFAAVLSMGAGHCRVRRADLRARPGGGGAVCRAGAGIARSRSGTGDYYARRRRGQGSGRQSFAHGHGQAVSGLCGVRVFCFSGPGGGIIVDLGAHILIFSPFFHAGT